MSSILLKQVNDYKKSHQEPTSSETNTKEILCKEPSKALIIKLINFEFLPKKVKIPKGTLVQWEIGSNHAVYSTIYSSTERSFFLCIEELEIQSPELFPGSKFSYRFMQEGVFEVICLNYSRVKSIITVFGEEKCNEIVDNSSKDLPIYYNKSLKIEENWKEKKKEEAENMNKSYLNDFPNEFFGKIDQEFDFLNIENEITQMKESSESDDKTNELYDNSNLIETPKKNQVKESSDLKELIKNSLILKENLAENLLFSDIEKEIVERTKNFLEVRYELHAFFFANR